ncbi:MAG: hypothetical protein ACI9HJ_001138, partial [Ulvibacter sp.]
HVHPLIQFALCQNSSLINRWLYLLKWLDKKNIRD